MASFRLHALPTVEGGADQKAQIILDGFSDELHDRRDKNEKEKFRNEWRIDGTGNRCHADSLIDVTRLSAGYHVLESCYLFDLIRAFSRP